MLGVFSNSVYIALRTLQAILNKSWRQHPTRHQLYGHLPPITKTIQVRRTRRAGHCWRSKDELISDLLLWTPTYGQAKAGWPAQTYIQQLCEDMGCSPEDLPEAMNDREKWRERVRDICAPGMTWWWRWIDTEVFTSERWFSFKIFTHTDQWVHLLSEILCVPFLFLSQTIWQFIQVRVFSPGLSNVL